MQLDRIRLYAQDAHRFGPITLLEHDLLEGARAGVDHGEADHDTSSRVASVFISASGESNNENAFKL